MSSNSMRLDETTYKRRINAWAMYDWANSAFATTILASLLPIYYSTVAGATLPSEATATAYWSLTISASLFIIAILSPILGTVSDVMRGKKRLLSIFIGIGVVGCGLLIFVGTGDWLLASLFFLLGRIGFGGSIVFYDALLPHVAREGDRDWVSSRGYALGYLGGGIMLAINVAMFMFIPDSLFEHAGIRLSFLQRRHLVGAIFLAHFASGSRATIVDSHVETRRNRHRRQPGKAAADLSQHSQIPRAVQVLGRLPDLQRTPSAPSLRWRRFTARNWASAWLSWCWRY